MSTSSTMPGAVGCDHTPENFLGCDTCGRPPLGFNPRPHHDLRKVAAFQWAATVADVGLVTKTELRSIDKLHELYDGKVLELHVWSDAPGIPAVKLQCDPSKGERLHMFTRQQIRMNVNTGAEQRFSVLVFQVTLDPDFPDRFVRLYLHPVDGPILSTHDLEF